MPTLPLTPRSLKTKAQFSFKKLISLVGNILKEKAQHCENKSTVKGAPPTLVSAAACALPGAATRLLGVQRCVATAPGGFC